MSKNSNNDNQLEKAICLKADVQFQFKIEEWEDSRVEPEKLLAMREKNINKNDEPFDIYYEAIDIEIIYRYFPLFNQLIKIELDLRIANSTPFTEERILTLREFFREFISKEWRHIGRNAYYQTANNIIQHNTNKQLEKHQKDELDKLYSDWRRDHEVKQETIEINLKLIDPKLQDAFAESVIHAERKKNTLTQSGLETAKPQQEIVMGNKYSFGNVTGSNVNVDSVLNQAVQSIGAASSVNDTEKQQLTELIEQLKNELQKTPSEKKDEADALAKIAKTLIEEGTEVQPNKTMVQITADGLKKAAENIASVMPSVLTIASSIIRTVFSSAGIPLA